METAEERNKRRIVTIIEPAVPAMLWCRNIIYEIGRLLHPEEESAASPTPAIGFFRRRNSPIAFRPRHRAPVVRSVRCLSAAAVAGASPK